MTTNTYSGEFHQIWVKDSLGTEHEWSTYLQGAGNIKIGADDRDATTFETSGVASAEKHTRGAKTASLQAKFLYHPTLVQVLRQIIGSLGGFTVRTLSGSNAVPTYGDEVFIATMTLVSFTLNPTPGQNMVIDCTFVPADGGAIAPQLKVY